MNRIKQYLLLTRFDKPIGIFLLLWPTLWALWIAARGFPHQLVFVVFMLGVVFMRAAGCAINDFADRHFDGQVARTRNRPLASGKISGSEAIIIFCALSLCAFGLVLLMNRLTTMLSLVAVLLACMYPFMKRYTQLPQLILGIAFSWGIPMAFAAQTGQVPVIAWLLVLINILWVIVYDTMYAMSDREDDLKLGLKSTAILFGQFDVFIIIILQMVILALLIVVGWWLQLNVWFYIGLIVASVFFIYQQRLIRNRDPAACFKAFLNNSWFGLSVFVGLLLAFGFL